MSVSEATPISKHPRWKWCGPFMVNGKLPKGWRELLKGKFISDTESIKRQKRAAILDRLEAQ